MDLSSLHKHDITSLALLSFSWLSKTLKLTLPCSSLTMHFCSSLFESMSMTFWSLGISLPPFLNSLATSMFKFALKDLGPLYYFLGIHAYRYSTGLHLNQAKYIIDLLLKASMTESKPYASPMSSTASLSLYDGPLLQDATTYMSIVGALQYYTLTRPDIFFDVNKVCQLMQAPLESHWVAVKRILRYLKGTLHFGLYLTPFLDYFVTCYIDIDWASNPDYRRSTSGYCVFLGNSLTSWSSSKHKVVSKSNVESEYHGLANGTAELVWIQSILAKLDIPLSNVPVLLFDTKMLLILTLI